MAQRPLNGYVAVGMGDDFTVDDVSHRISQLTYGGSVIFLCGLWHHKGALERRADAPANYALTCIICAARAS